MHEVLVLGGTGLARRLTLSLARLAAAAADAGLADAGLSRRFCFIYSLAGRTQDPALPRAPNIRIRQGGFGGQAGLELFLQAHPIAFVLDATHRYAATMTRHAYQACQRLALPYFSVRTALPVLYENETLLPEGKALGVDRAGPGSGAGVAPGVLPPDSKNSRVLMALGESGHDKEWLAWYRTQPQSLFFVRTFQTPVLAPALDLSLSAGAAAEVAANVVFCRGPASDLTQEEHFLRDHRFTTVLARQGGSWLRHRRLWHALGLTVWLVPPPPEPVEPFIEPLVGEQDSATSSAEEEPLGTTELARQLLRCWARGTQSAQGKQGEQGEETESYAG